VETVILIPQAREKDPSQYALAVMPLDSSLRSE
jgi:hypothetical protein